MPLINQQYLQLDNNASLSYCLTPLDYRSCHIFALFLPLGKADDMLKNRHFEEHS